MRKMLVFLVCFCMISILAAAETAKAKKGITKVKNPAASDKVNPVTGVEDQGSSAKTEKSAVPVNSRFTDNGDGTVLDKNTGLIWLKDANVATLPLPYEGAKAYRRR